MLTASPKRMLIINILDILKRYTDENHRISQKSILDILENDYSMKADRKAIKRNLTNLIDFGYNIEYREFTRKNKRGEDESILTDWYLVRDFSDSELRLLIDSLLFSKHIPQRQCKELIGKLKKLSSTYFDAKVKHIRNLPMSMPTNKQLFLTVEVLDEAISSGKQVSFRYNDFGADKKLHPRKNDMGEVREYIINPYQIVATNGRYYLICNYDKYDEVSNYRLDRITDIHLLKTPVKPMKNVSGLENGLNLPKHMAEHIYMFTGENVAVKFCAAKKIIGEVIDWFGADVTFANEKGETVDITLTVNEQAMIFWALQYSEYVEVLEPIGLRVKLKTLADGIARKYREG